LTNLRSPRIMPVVSPIFRGISVSNVGSYADRENRFEARSRRRYGDWSVLDIPTVLLWMDVAPDPDPENECDG
jgi:hypothetical protein